MPPRTVPQNDDIFVSPANGTVIGVKPFDAKYLVELKNGVEAGAVQLWTNDVAESGTIISIALSLTDVHYQRAPVNSTVLKITHTDGNYNNAIAMPDNSFVRYENEHNEVLMQSAEHGYKFKIIQIAGLVARRIVDSVKVGDQVIQGQIIGAIIMGSQVAVIVPPDIDVTVKPGDYLYDGQTAIGTVKTGQYLEVLGEI